MSILDDDYEHRKSMNSYDRKHYRMAQAMVMAKREGIYRIKVGDYEEALSLRAAFYTFFRYLERVAKRAEGSGLERVEEMEAMALLKIRDDISLRCYKDGGILELRWRCLNAEMILQKGLEEFNAGERVITKKDIRDMLDDKDTLIEVNGRTWRKGDWEKEQKKLAKLEKDVTEKYSRKDIRDMLDDEIKGEDMGKDV